VVEHDLAKVGVEGSNPFARSRIFLNLAKCDEGPLNKRAFRFADGCRAFRDGAIAPDAQQACNRTIPAAMKKRAATRSIVAKSALYTAGYHDTPGYRSAARPERKNRLK
jgi:hypothetical protein